ncbi:GNAT family N-acetyltransferase [Aliiglaciecola sp. LCG003]|uniref:GNAT family N-acetyltransferase n=1 Tax=Aliiglaciecola sp. LCG003 TaxID=3053655 RepID=UPI0033659510
MQFHFQFIHSVDDISKEIWDELSKNQGLFCRYDFLAALESSGSVGADTGWLPNHLVAYQQESLVAILPLYKKTHSYGEYVFDFAWAEAYQRHQMDYYPKLVNAIPFTPVTGVRCLFVQDIDQTELLQQMVLFINQQLSLLGMSSFHSLFPTQASSELMQSAGCSQRKSVQFQWFNRNYVDFDDFLATFTARRRKSVRKERQKVLAQQVMIKRYSGAELSATEMNFFYLCYCQTYLKRSGHTGYLTQAFFNQLLDRMPENLLLVIAHKHDKPIAGALYLFDQDQLCGRYWGALENVDGLHFECCYYQGIEFCIEKHLDSFNPGTQGEHKILRGFEPIFCYSNHWLADETFQQAVNRFIEQETPQIETYKITAAQLLPFKQINEQNN